MNICYVAPLDTTKKLGILTYFSTLDTEKGDLVEIQINKRKLSAIILHVETAEDAKQDLRTSLFQIKKITKIIKKNAISKDVFVGFENAAGVCGTIISKMVDVMIPKNSITELADIKKNKVDDDNLESIIINNDHNILVEIKKIVREEFAKKKSLAIIAPTIIAAENIFDEIKNGIENKCVIYHSDLSEKNQNKAEENIKEIKNVCIISTPSLVSLLKENIDTFIFWDESSKYYKSYEEEIDTKKAISLVVKNLNKKIIYTGNTPSIELYQKFKNKKVAVIQKDFVRDELEKIKVIKLDNKKEKLKCIYWDNETEIKIIRRLHDNEKIVIFSERRGMATTCVCADCSTVKKCMTCDKPYVLHEQEGARIFICHTCKKREIIKKDEEIMCENCGGWRMESLGVGVTGIKNYLKEIIDENMIYTIDSDSVKTKKEALKIYRKFNENGGVLIGTEMILPLIKNINFILIASIDSLFSIPEYNLDEEIFKTLIKLNGSLTKNGEMIINTRTDEKVFEYIQNNNIEKILNYELKNREDAGLPPYSYIITFDIEKNINKIPRFLEIFPNYNVNGREYRRNIIMIPCDKWESDENLRQQTIANLLNYNLKINPRNIFKGIL
jgi:primosomal protein N'